MWLVSSESSRSRTSVSPLASAASSSTRFEMLFDPGRRTVPERARMGGRSRRSMVLVPPTLAIFPRGRRRSSRRPQLVALDLAALRRRESRHQLDLARIEMATELRLHEIHDLVLESGPRDFPGLEHDVRLHDLAPQRIRLADDRRLRNGGMSQDRRLHLERADAVARALDDVVRAALEPEVAVGIAAAEVTDHHPPPTETLGVARLIVPVPDRVV